APQGALVTAKTTAGWIWDYQSHLAISSRAFATHVAAGGRSSYSLNSEVNMKTQKDLNTTNYTDVYVHHQREGNYPADFGTYHSGTNYEVRVLTRSTGIWKPGGGRKPEQPYQNTRIQYRVPHGKVVAYERNRGYGEGRHVFNGSVGTFFQDGFIGTLVPAHHGGSVASFPDISSLGVNPDLLSQAEVKCYNKLDALPRGSALFDAAVAAGERRETARMLMSAVYGTLNLARAVHGIGGRGRQWEWGVSEVLKDAFGVNVHPARLRRRYQNRLRKLKKSTLAGEITRGVATASLMADMWLTYRLGVTPLMSELDGLYNIVKHQPADPSNFTFKVTARHYRERASMQQRGTDYKSSGRQEFYASELHGYTVTLVAAPTEAVTDTLSQLGLDNPAGTIWELTTLSFVVDYFVNVGSFLQALNVPKRFKFVDGSWTQRIVRTYSTSMIGPEANARGVATCDHTRRFVYEQFPVPIPPLSLNGEDLTAKRFLTMAALAVVKLRKLLQ
ncbi:maturation protein, partial [ssRNA phage SRR6960799_11]